MTPPSTAPAPPREPAQVLVLVLVTIGLRPPADPTGMPPVPQTVALIGDGEFHIIVDLDEAAVGAECTCSASDDQPY